jgi:hypothetical protein
VSQEVLPSPSETTRSLTFNVPNILLKREDQNGFPLFHVRLGGPTQIEFKTSVTYSEQPIDESSRIFVIKATNKINFGDGSIRVLNDAMHGTHPLAATCPTANEYMNKVGKPVLLSFRCSQDQQESTRLERSIFRVVRVSILLP